VSSERIESLAHELGVSEQVAEAVVRDLLEALRGEGAES